MAYTSNLSAVAPLLYEEGFRAALQQQSSRTRPFANIVPINGKSKRFNKMQASSMVPITSRFGTTNPNELFYDFRTLYVNFAKDAKRIDRREAMLMGAIGDPLPGIVRAQAMGAGRHFDQVLVNGLLGDAFEGENGQTNVGALPTTNDIVANFITGAPAGSGTNTGLTFDKILRISEQFGTNNISGQDIEGKPSLVLLCTHREITDLRSTEKWTSYYYQNDRPLAGEGEFYNVLGIRIVPLDPALLPYNPTTGVRTCIAYSKEHMAFGMAEDINTRLSELVDGNYDWQAYAEVGYGATRLFDEAVYRVYCDALL